MKKIFAILLFTIPILISCEEEVFDPKKPKAFLREDFKEVGYTEHFTIPDSCGYIRIGYQTFYKSENLISVTIPSFINRIPNGAFWGCKELKAVYIPNSIVYFGEEMFVECDNLNSVYIEDENPMKDLLIKVYGDLIKVK